MTVRWTFKPRRASTPFSLASLPYIVTIFFVLAWVNNKANPTTDPLDSRMLPFVSAGPMGSAETDPSEFLAVVVTAGMLKVGKISISLMDSPESIRAAFTDTLAKERKRDGKVRSQFTVQADSRVPYSQIDRIVTAAAAVGITRLHFLGRVGGDPQ